MSQHIRWGTYPERCHLFVENIVTQFVWLSFDKTIFQIVGLSLSRLRNIRIIAILDWTTNKVQTIHLSNQLEYVILTSIPFVWFNSVCWTYPCQCVHCRQSDLDVNRHSALCSEPLISKHNIPVIVEWTNVLFGNASSRLTKIKWCVPNSAQRTNGYRWKRNLPHMTDAGCKAHFDGILLPLLVHLVVEVATC